MQQLPIPGPNPRAKKIRPPKKPNYFLSSFYGSLTAFAVIGGFGFAGMVYLLVVFSVAATGDGKENVSVPDNSVLVLDLWMNISDTPQSQGLDRIVDEALFGPGTPNLYLLEVVDAIERAAEDDRITALFIYGSLMPENYGSGLAALREVRGAIVKFKESGKPVYAYTMDPTLKDYYLMSASDNIFMNPFGVLGLNGLASEGMFFGNAFEKYGIGVQTTRVGKYKSAVEMFTSDRMSPADKEQVTSLLNDIWDNILDEVADSRGLDLSFLESQTDAEGFFSAAEAKDLDLVDDMAYFDEVLEQLESVASYDYDLESFSQIDISDYIKAVGFHQELDPFGFGNQIAVVYAEGDIVSGEGFPDQVGGERLARDLRELRENPDVVAVVLRVNSPGGSALAAEVIQREIIMTQKTKPVVVSMGSLAASGGYWISASAQKIYAEPTTITGSIGVWGLLPNIKKLANEHGITFDGVKTAPYANIYTISREKTPEEMALIQEFTDFIYDQFLEKVATGRDMDIEAVNEIAQGRVWTGEQAVQIGLVDEIGGLQDAIYYAAEIADAGNDWSVMQVPDKKDFNQALTEFFNNPGGEPPVIQQRKGLVTSLTEALQSEFALFSSFNDPRGVYARLPFQLDIN